MTRAEFRRRFPRLFLVRALDPFDALDKGYGTEKTWWLYMAPFEFVSDVWGSILIPEGMITDFASVPRILHSLYDSDCPIMLYPSAPHDFLFQRAADGSRGWLMDGRRLSLHEANCVLAEAMEVCGASPIDRGNVLAAVEIANQYIRHEFRS